MFDRHTPTPTHTPSFAPTPFPGAFVIDNTSTDVLFVLLLIVVGLVLVSLWTAMAWKLLCPDWQPSCLCKREAPTEEPVENERVQQIRAGVRAEKAAAAVQKTHV